MCLTHLQTDNTKNTAYICIDEQNQMNYRDNMSHLATSEVTSGWLWGCRCSLPLVGWGVYLCHIWCPALCLCLHACSSQSGLTATLGRQIVAGHWTSSARSANSVVVLRYLFPHSFFSAKGKEARGLHGWCNISQNPHLEDELWRTLQFVLHSSSFST